MTESEGVPEARPAEFVQSLDRGLMVIRAFSDKNSMLSLSDVARITGLSRASARRFLLTLAKLGYVGSRHNHYFLRPRVLDLGYAYLSSSSAVDIVQDHLEELSLRITESCSACAYDAGEIVYVARAAADRIMSIRLSVGRRLPAFCTSTGRMLLAYLSPSELDAFFENYSRTSFTEWTVTDQAKLREIIAETRLRGWSSNDQELETGARSIAAPILDTHGSPLYAANISVPTSRVSMEALEGEFLPQLLETTRKISADLLHIREA